MNDENEKNTLKQNEQAVGPTGFPSASALPDPPYYAVIFSTRRRNLADEDYAQSSAMLFSLAESQPGYLGAESYHDDRGDGVTISYWRDEAAIAAWKNVAAHRIAQRRGLEDWYERYTLRVCKVERAYDNTGRIVD